MADAKSLPLPADAWEQIAGWLAAADIDCIELGAPGRMLRMVRGAGGYRVDEVVASAPAPDRPSVGPVGVVAPCAGILLDRHPAGACGFPRTGERVMAGDLVGLLRIGLVLAPVVAPVSGTITHMLVTVGAPVGYGTCIMEIMEGDA
jgi:acetyl-CoA carboxylase biotin carboxyl carrier protein